MTEWLKIGIISSLLDISSEVESACVGLTSWQSSRELTSWAFWQERMEPARLSITHTADRSMKNVICGREEGGEKDKIVKKCSRLNSYVFESSRNTRGRAYFANYSSLKVISADHQRGN